ncbi:hypothetical protein lerEdw1_008162 [Lerista edwardsae]|nr:hypothetical protein lerEdw1_008162 [Lerista edwardsae]
MGPKKDKAAPADKGKGKADKGKKDKADKGKKDKADKGKGKKDKADKGKGKKDKADKGKGKKDKADKGKKDKGDKGKGKKDKDAKKAGKRITKAVKFGELYPPTARWSTMAVFGVLCVSFIVVACVLYNKEVNVDYQSVEDQFDRLRHAIADVLHQDDLNKAPPSQTATEAGRLKSYIEEEKKTFQKKRAEYVLLYTLGRRTHRSWLAHAKSMYFLSKGKKNWYDAERFCIYRGSHLTSILSEEEQDFITSQVKYPIWIGLTDEKEKGMWEWSDSSGFTVQYWNTDKPKRPPDSQEIEQHCASLTPSTSTYNWNEADCYTPHRWVCKRSLAD